MTNKGTVQLETPRLILRRFTERDVEAAFRNWTGDAKVTEFLTWPTHPNAGVTERILNDWIAGYESDAYYQWAIEVKDLQEPIGTISAVKVDEKTQKAHLGYCIGSKWWNQGYMSEALTAVIKFFFEEVELLRLEARHDPNNPNSGKVMEKCGMKYEGTLRQNDWSNKGIVDARWYGMLAEEYLENKAIWGRER